MYVSVNMRARIKQQKIPNPDIKLTLKAQRKITLYETPIVQDIMQCLSLYLVLNMNACFE